VCVYMCDMSWCCDLDLDSRDTMKNACPTYIVRPDVTQSVT